VKQLFENIGVLIRRVDFSEPQAGKGPCDRKAAVIKGEIRRYVDENHDCTNAREFVAAAKSTQNLSIFASSIFETGANETQMKKASWPGIKNINNVEFRIKNGPAGNKTLNDISYDIEIATWRAFGIGDGQLLSWSKMKNPITSIIPLEEQNDAKHINENWTSDGISSDGIKKIFFFYLN
jgi:hypothetical protein